jgi:hypothetical protein
LVIPLATTTITIERPRGDEDPYDTPVVRPQVTGVRAVIGSPSGRDHIIGGDQSVVTAKLNCDLCDLRHYDEVIDDTTGDRYSVVWVRRRVALGLDHLAAGLNTVEGQAGG